MMKLRCKANTCCFAKKCDRVEMLRLRHLTREFGLNNEALCAALEVSPCGIVWPEGTLPPQRNERVFDTMLLNDALESEFWNGNCFRTVKKEKRARAKVMMTRVDKDRQKSALAQLLLKLTLFRGETCPTTFCCLIFINSQEHAQQMKNKKKCLLNMSGIL
jgi:hypothetical protein